jgi:Fe-S-cluster containining protein
MADDILAIYRRWLQFSPMDDGLVARQKENVLAIARESRSGEAALEMGRSAAILAEHLIARVEGESSLPRPIVCRAGCPLCCFNQVELTPAEALLVGHYVEERFSPEEKQELLARVAENLARKAGKDKREIALMRRELPCPFLREERCSIYPVRPLLCRAMHSLDAEQCRLELISPVTHFEFYSHRYEIVLSVSAGLAAGCRDLGCQAGALDLAQAVQDFFAHPRPLEGWLKGEQVFKVAAREPGKYESHV